MAKVNEKNKVALLEAAVISGNREEVKAAIETYGSFELTARAFGIACLYSTLDMVNFLAEKGFRFQYTEEAKKKYKIEKQTYSDTYAPDYYLMLAYTENTFWDDYHFGMLPQITAEKNDLQTRLYMLEWMLEDPARYGVDLSKLLYYAVLWRNREMAAALINRGVTLAERQTRWLIRTDRCWNRDELNWAVRTMSEEDLIYVLQTFAFLLQKEEKKVALTHGMVEQEAFGKTDINHVILQPSVMKVILETADVEKLKKGELMALLVKEDKLASLELLVHAGWLKTAAQKEKLMQCAAEHEKTEIQAWLMDYHAKNTDPVKEQEKEEARIRRALNTAVSPLAELKKLWNYAKRDDGNLEITGYKGNETQVHVPAVIGKAQVTVIGNFAFFPLAPRIKNGSARNAIERIVIAEGVRMIDRDAICYMDNLKEVVIADSVRFIGSGNFQNCSVTLRVRAGSYAEKYAQNHSIPFVTE